MDAAALRRTLVRHRYLVFAVVALALVGAAWAFERSRDTGAEAAGYLGPTPGPDADGHISAKRAYLENLAASDPQRPAAGLVSLSGLLTSADADVLTEGYEVVAVFVSFSGFGQEVLPVETSVSDAVRERSEEIAEIRDAEAAALAERGDTDAASAKRDAAETLRSGCGCVYALVVQHSTAAGLLTLLGSDDVLLVDVPDPPVPDLGGWELTPIHPED